jgi:putative transposase
MSPPALLNRIWIADITYLPLKGSGFAYLASVVDLCSRRVVGWALDVQMNELLVLDALQHAISARQPTSPSTPVKPIAPCCVEPTSVRA